MADSLVERYRRDHGGAYPRSVGLSVWGTSAMRTSGDDIAEVSPCSGCARSGTRCRAASPAWR